ncbi:MAG: hypothetical protein H0T77_13570 [Pyrinomonadaceae bacterium]|nr:hypothetical protein [Pyrinomonadaceae bacterium]
MERGERGGKPERDTALVALSIGFLASDWAGYITGEILDVNGGAVLCG